MKVYKYLLSLKNVITKKYHIPSSHDVIYINTMKGYKYLLSLKNATTKKIITFLIHTMLFT